MELFQQILLNVWQEACRQVEVGRSTANIAALLARHIPVEQVLICHIDPTRVGVETIAVGFPHAAPLRDVHTECSAGDLDALLAWCHRGLVSRRGDDAASRVLSVLVDEHSNDVLVGPLGDPAGICGALVLLAPKDLTFTAEHANLTQLLLEPIAVALGNDLRMREITALREAAEADKRSLLTKLGRKALGDTIVGADSGLHAVMERVELVAKSDAPVLIFGETGTGKEVIARAIHNRSLRHNGPFDRVNCGAIPPELIDSQLFGHERGAFTGAVEARRGWFERADGGTLFLDEIGELPLAAQVRMLRILQDGWMERVGAEKSINVDVRIIAATHRDLASMVAEGRFREDLWYRIAVFPVMLPPLRERRGDIPALARHFAGKAATRFGLTPAMPTPNDLALLSAYSWPGNIRELAAVIDRAAILGNGKQLEVATALGKGSTIPVPSVAGGLPSTPACDPAAPGKIDSLNGAIRRHIEAALIATHGRIEGQQGAAAMLEINPHTLRAKMRKLGIDWASFRKDNGTHED